MDTSAVKYGEETLPLGQDVQIIDGTSDDEEATEQDTLDNVSFEHGIHILSLSISREAMSYSRPSYPPSSVMTVPRTDIFAQINEWLGDRRISSILWLYGPPKARKYICSQKAAELCRANNQLGGTFFFRRAGIEEDQTHFLFATLAYQLACNVPGLLEPINRIMCLDPTLPTKSMATQFHSLIVEAFAQYTPTRTAPTPIIILDRLDDCPSVESQLAILDIIARSTAELKLPLRYIITSRPEPHLREAFKSDPLYEITQGISIDDQYDSTIHDPSSRSDPQQEQEHRSLPFLHRLVHSPLERERIHCLRPETYSTHDFPQVVSVQSSNGDAEAYSRSPLPCGKGFPVWYPGDDLGKSLEYLQKGPSIGDVGILDREGIFDTSLPPDDPIHSHSVPREFHPIDPLPRASEIAYVPDYFKPGEVVTSKGIHVTVHTKDPPDISFTSTEKEDGILVLPQGASREDLISTDRFHDFARKNAPHWYQVVNGYDGIVHTNGTLFLVTGCDKTNDWAVASFPYHPGKGPNSVDVRYTWQPNYGSPWTDKGTARTRFHAPPSSSSIPFDAKSPNQCVFVRGIRISLSELSWERTMPQLPSARLYYTYILNSPSKARLLFHSVLVWLRLRLSEKQAMKKVTSSRLQLFHPNFIISQVLLQMYPGAEVALVNDSVWCSITESGYGTVTDINNLVTKVFEKYRPVEHGGTVTLVPKSEEELNAVKEDTPKITRRGRLLSLLLAPLRHPSAKEETEWVKHVSVSDHAKLF